MAMSNNRRAFLKKATVTIGTGTLLAGCTGGDGGDGGDGDGTTNGNQLDDNFKVGSSPLDASEPHRGWGAREKAPEMYNGWSVPLISAADTQTLTQAVLSGQTMGTNGGFATAAPLMETGKPFAAYYSITPSAGDYVLVSQPEVDSLQAIVDQQASVGMSGPNALEVVMIMALMLQEDLIDSREDLNYQNVGYSSARQAAMINGDLGVSAQHYSQWLVMKEEKPELNNLGAMAELLEGDPNPNVWMTTPRMAEQYHDEWVALFSATLESARMMYDDKQLFIDAVTEYVPSSEIPDQSQLDQLYEFSVEYDLWPKNGDLTEKTQNTTIEVLNQLNVTENKLDRNEVFDRSLLEDALDNVGRV